MTRENMTWKSGAKPFLLKPAGKDYLWGGSRLNDDFSKNIPMSPLAETWECSTHPDGPSRVGSGEYEGWLLSEVLKLHPEYLGIHGSGVSMAAAGEAVAAGKSAEAAGEPAAAGKFAAAVGEPAAARESAEAAGEAGAVGQLPILIKFIDAKQDLSVQVHPDDDYAFRMEEGQRGKTEMWYVLDAARGGRLVYGLSHDVDPEALRRSLYQGTVEKYLQKVPIHKDDIFFIEPGTVHAVGAGALIAEIQENSNLTYRMYDYNRVDKNGRKRQLHIEKAMDVVNTRRSTEPRQPLRVLKYQPGWASEFLCRCKYFQVERMLLNTERCRSLADFQTDSHSYQVLLCIEGCGLILEEDGETLPFFRGDCIFVPADSAVLRIHGRAQLLKVTG